MDIKVRDDIEKLKKMSEIKYGKRIVSTLDHEKKVLNIDSMAIVEWHAQDIFRRQINFTEERIKETLIDLGWTPPESELTEEDRNDLYKGKPLMLYTKRELIEIIKLFGAKELY
jgi:hypothetical protein